jgi:2-polyprenyl-3-methyl-5-hydroxy-6-metoxy-1,4-benzoquinol methylase
MNELQKLEEEVFCLKYELNIFSKAYFHSKLERWIPDYSYQQTEKEHFQRYELICRYIKNKKVLDIACGTGRGSYMMAMGGADTICGVDIDADTIRYASFRNFHLKIIYQIGDATKFISANKFEVIISFETVEHIPDYKLYLKQLENNLEKDGVLFISTPISNKILDENPINPYHVREWGFKAFQNAISEYFEIDKIFIQVYPEVKKKSLFSRIYYKLHTPLYQAPPSISIYDYSQNKLNEKLLGHSYRGYQILMCKKK